MTLEQRVEALEKEIAAQKEAANNMAAVKVETCIYCNVDSIISNAFNRFCAS